MRKGRTFYAGMTEKEELRRGKRGKTFEGDITGGKVNEGLKGGVRMKWRRGKQG